MGDTGGIDSDNVADSTCMQSRFTKIIISIMWILPEIFHLVEVYT